MMLLPWMRDVIQIERAALFKIRLQRSGFRHGKAAFELNTISRISDSNDF
jgi:hypothetical protein